MTQIKKFMTLILTAAFALFGVGSAWAATRTWGNGGIPTDGEWNDATKWGTKPGSGDSVVFPDTQGETVTITLPESSATICAAFTVNAGGKYVFVRPSTVAAVGDATYTIGGQIKVGSGASLMFKDAQVNSSTGTGWSLAGDLLLENTVMSISASSTIDGVTVSLKDSTLTVASGKNITFKETTSDPTTLILDNSTFRVTSGNFPGGSYGGTIFFCGKAPRLIVGSTYQSADSKFITMKFNIPIGGYEYVPLTVKAGNAFPVNGFTTFEIDPESAIFMSDFDGVVPLVASVYYIRNEWSGKSGSVKGATFLSLDETKMAELLSADPQGAFDYRYCKTAPTVSDAVITDGVIPDGLTWETVRTDKDHIDGVYIKGVPPPPEYAEPTFTEPVVTGGKGKMTATTTVTLDPYADMSVDTASITFRYRPAASQGDGDWLSVTENLTEDGPVTVALPVAGLADETDYTVEVTARHDIHGKPDPYVSDPVMVSPVTVQPAALAPTFADPALTLTAGADGASFAVEVSIAAFDETFAVGGNDTATAYMRYRIKESGAAWTESTESPIDATTMKAELSATVAKVTEDTVYEVEVYTKHVIGGYTYLAKTPATGEVTVSKPADTLPGFGETALAPKENGVTATAITLTADIEKLGDGARSATVTLKIRESGSLGEGTPVDTEEISAAGAVELTAMNLEPGGTYELWVVVENDEDKSVECGKITVTTAPTAPSFGDPALTVGEIGVNAISVTAAIAALGAKSVPCDVTLYVREAGATGDGTAKAATQVTVTGDVLLTATGLDEETAYVVRVVAKHSADGFADAVATTEWTQVTTDATPPAFGAFASDGASGDTLVVTGAMRSAGTVLVQVSTTEDFAAIYAEQSAGLIATDATFVQSFHAEKGAADYIAPGETYFVRLIATKGMHAVTSAVKLVTMAAASGVEVTGYAHANGTVTITGRVNPLGAGTSTVHILWGNDGMNFPHDETIEVSASTGPDWTFTKTDYTDDFCYRIYVENSCSTESWATTPVLGTGSETPTDRTDTYYWKADANENWSGNWEDPDHWEACDSSGNPITGYHADFPDQKEFKVFSFSRIPEGSEVTVNLPARAMSWGTMTELPGRANASLTLKGTPDKTIITFANTSIRTMSSAGEKLVLDGLSLTFPQDFNMNAANQYFAVRNGAIAKFTATDKSFRIATSSPSGSYTNNVVIDNATIDMSAMNGYGAFWLGDGSRAVVNVVIRGKNPLLMAATMVTTASQAPSVVFEIPEGGYASTPIVGGGGKTLGERNNSTGKIINYLVDRASPALQQEIAQEENYTLIDWTAGINKDLAVLDNSGEEVAVRKGELDKTVMQMVYDNASAPTKIGIDLRKVNFVATYNGEGYDSVEAAVAAAEADDEPGTIGILVDAEMQSGGTIDPSKEIVIDRTGASPVPVVQTSTAVMQGVTAGGKALTANTQKLREFLVANEVAAYTAGHTSSEAISAALAAVPTVEGNNGLPLWKDYALGISPTDSVKAVADAAKDTDPDAITLAIPTIDPAKASGDFAIRYKVIDRATKVETSTATDPTAIKIPLATGVYDVKIVFEPSSR